MEENFEKKSNKKIGIIIAVILILVILAIVAGGLVFLNNNKKPEKIFAKTVEDMFQMSEEEANARTAKVGLELSADIESTDPEIKAMNQILNAIKINFTTEMDLDKKILNANILATYDDEQIVSLDGLIQDEKLYVYLRDLYSRYIEVNEQYLEGMDLSTIFETTSDTASKDLLNDIKQILLDEINSREFTQERVELNGENVQKSTLRLTAKELLQITLKMMKKVYEYQPTEEYRTLIQDLEDEIEYLEENENYVDISIYTQGFKNELVKADIVLVNVEADEVIVFEVNKNSSNETIISMAINEESTQVSQAAKLIELTINEENENKGSIEMKMNIEEGYSVAVTVKYDVEYNVTIEERNTQNSIDIDSLTDADFNEIMSNIQNNEILYGIIESMIAPIVETQSTILNEAAQMTETLEEEMQKEQEYSEQEQERIEQILEEYGV